jgi:hypothetical protein
VKACRTLASSRLVCRAWNGPATTIFFRSLYLRRNIVAFLAVLGTIPNAAQLVRSLTISFEPTYKQQPAHLLELLPKLTYLRSLQLQGSPAPSMFEPFMRSLSRGRSSVTYLRLSECELDAPARLDQLIASFPLLQQIHMQDVSFILPSMLGIQTPSAKHNLLMVTDLSLCSDIYQLQWCSNRISVDHLRSLTVDIVDIMPGDGSRLWDDLMQHALHLRHLTLNCTHGVQTDDSRFQCKSYERFTSLLSAVSSHAQLCSNASIWRSFPSSKMCN